MLSSPAWADCTDGWQSGEGIPGLGAYAQALAVFDDGTGPALYAGGAFTVAGDAECSHVAKWNGTRWAPLGSGVSEGLNDYTGVEALTVFNGELIAAGSFTIAGEAACNSIARWNGTSWASLDSGMNNTVSALTVFNGQLIAGGIFTSAGSATCNYIAKWNGTSWAPLGGGMNGGVNALTVFGGELIAGGSFTTAGGVTCNYIAKWNGTSWAKLSSGINGDVLALSVFRSELIAGGLFTRASGLACENIAKWNGTSWTKLSSGVDDTVSAMTVFNGELIAGGAFFTAGGVECNRVARWNGTSWGPLDGEAYDGVNDEVTALTVFNGELIGGGYFTGAGGNACSCIAQWNSTNWAALGGGMNSYVNAMTAFNGELIAGGWGVAGWNGTRWESLGGWTDGNVFALTLFNGELIAGGDFWSAGSVACNYIARWNGSDWAPVGAGLGGGEGWGVRALTVYHGELIAGGDFTMAGSVLCNGLAKWNGSSWEVLGDGLDTPLVLALTVFNDELIVGGYFTMAGSVECNNIAKWNGSDWSALGSGIDFAGSYVPVAKLGVFNGELIAAGVFLTAGGEACNSIAKWNGSAWAPLGSGMAGGSDPLNPYVAALTVFQGELIAGGNFTSAGDVDCNYIAKWNGSDWAPLGSGMNGATGDSTSTVVTALAVFKGELMAGGDFTTAGGLTSFYWASWWESLAGDANIDGIVNGSDIEAFILAILNPGAYIAQFSSCLLNCDYNRDGVVDTLDMAPFLDTLLEREPSSGVLQFKSASYTAMENGGSLRVFVSRTGGSDGAASVDYATADDSATAGSDYTDTSGTLDWSNWDAADKYFDIPILDDSAYEGNETFTITLSGASGAALGSPTATTVTIIDDEGPPAGGSLQFISASYTVAETDGSVRIFVSRTGGSAGPAGVSYATADGSATAGSDYTSTAGTLDWADGDTADKYFDVPILDDSAYEGDETFTVALSGATGAALATPNETTVTITDNETPPAGSLQFMSASYTVAENGGTMRIFVSRTGGSNGAASANYATADGSATAGSDYTDTSGTLDWSDGDTADKYFDVPILDDSAYEGDETFTVSLSGAIGAALGSPTATTVTITDNESPPVDSSLQFKSASYTVAESVGSVRIFVSRTGGSSGAASVTYTTADGSAKAGTDYIATSGSLDWPNGDAADKYCDVPIIEDRLYEFSETFTITLSGASGAVLGSPIKATVVIADNENMITWYRDADGDGYGDPRKHFRSAEQFAGYVADGTDCDDNDPTVHDNCSGVAASSNPGATSLCGLGFATVMPFVMLGLTLVKRTMQRRKSGHASSPRGFRFPRRRG